MRLGKINQTSLLFLLSPFTIFAYLHPIYGFMRLWKWLKLGFDQTFSGAWWKQLLWLTSVIVFFFVGMYILRPQVGISPQTESVFTSPAEQETAGKTRSA